MNSNSSSDDERQDPTLDLPRILCLHGGGTNARIFRAQCRAITAQLKHEFRFVFAEAPLSSKAGPDVLSVYSSWGPFKRWLRWLPEHPNPGPESIANQVNDAIEAAIILDDLRGATGEFVAVLGFSQGAKVAASLLFRQQCQEQIHGKGNASTHFKFGVLLAGRGPLAALGPEPDILGLQIPDAAQITTESKVPSGHGRSHRVQIPTLHVHGMKDPGLDLHRNLYEIHCESRSRRLIQWNGGHRLPIKKADVSRIVYEMRDLARLYVDDSDSD